MNIYDELINTIKRLILDDNVSSYQINKDTGVSYGNINAMRRGERSIENLTLKNAERLYNYQKRIEKMNELQNKMVEDVVLGEVKESSISKNENSNKKIK